jgi:hypothetical protein
MGLPEYHMPIHSNAVYGFILEDPDDPDERDKYDLSAPYQRDSVWTVDRRRNLIRSLLMGLPIGNIILSHLPYRGGSPYSYRVIDGKQRIETLRMFANDEFSVPGDWFTDTKTGESIAKDEVVWSDLSPSITR